MPIHAPISIDFLSLIGQTRINTFRNINLHILSRLNTLECLANRNLTLLGVLLIHQQLVDSVIGSGLGVVTEPGSEIVSFAHSPTFPREFISEYLRTLGASVLPHLPISAFSPW